MGMEREGVAEGSPRWVRLAGMGEVGVGCVQTGWHLVDAQECPEWL